MNKHVEEVCKIGQGKYCCRYLVAGTEGLECAKLTTLKSILDKRVYSGTMNAQGDNCKGGIDLKEPENENSGINN